MGYVLHSQKRDCKDTRMLSRNAVFGRMIALCSFMARSQPELICKRSPLSWPEALA